MNDRFIKDIMLQNYQCDNYYDPTKLFIVLALIGSKGFNESYSLNQIATEVYRLYIKNTEIASHNFNIIIRNISKYGVADIYAFVSSTINQWIKEQKYGSFKFKNNMLFLSIEDYSSESANLIKTVCTTLFQKYYKCKLIPVDDYSSCKSLNDRNLEEFGNSLLKNLIFEDLQYCPLCEETNKERLVVVHILFNDEADSPEETIDKNNLLLLCRTEAEEYVKGLFYFDEFGRVVNLGSKIVTTKMRLSQNFLNDSRRHYLYRHSIKLKGRR